MRLKVIACSLVWLMPTYADGDYADAEVAESGDVERESPSEAKREEAHSGNKWVVFWGEVGLISDYVHRGQTQTFGGPALQGQFVVGQKKDEGLYAGGEGSNISDTIAQNGSGLELKLFAGYAFKYDPNLSFKLEVLNTRYPGAYAPVPTKDTYDMVEITPSVTYKFFSFLWAYSVTNASGVNQNFAPTFSTPLTPNGNSRGSWYAEANATIPVSFISHKLNFTAAWGYSYFRHYTKLNYNNFGAGLNYELPENWSGAILSVNGSATSANKKYYKLTNASGLSKNSVAPKIWVGIKKEF